MKISISDNSVYSVELRIEPLVESIKRLRMLEFYMERGADSAADNNDYIELNTNTAKKNDYLYLEKDDDLVPFKYL